MYKGYVDELFGGKNLENYVKAEKGFVESMNNEGDKEPEEKPRYVLTPEGRISMRAEAYARGEISLEDFYRLESNDTFEITKEEFNKMTLFEQNEIFKNHPDAIRRMLEK